jgi:hypothetical protein
MFTLLIILVAFIGGMVIQEKYAFGISLNKNHMYIDHGRGIKRKRTKIF